MIPSGQAIHYNGHHLSYNRLTFSQRPVYDSDGRSVMYVETTYNVEGIIGADLVNTLPELLIELRKALAEPGKVLYICETSQGTTTSVPPFSGGGRVDSLMAKTDGKEGDPSYFAREINWGPFPGQFDVTEIPGGQLALYRWSVVVNEPPGYAAGDSYWYPDHEGFTFASVYAVDQDGFQTRTIAGKLTVAAEKVPPERYLSDLFKLFPIPKNGEGWRRISQVHQLSEDSRVMSFSIVDKEMLATLPSPVTGGEATYTTSFAPMSMLLEFSLQGTFSAPKTGGKLAVYQAILALAKAKIPFFDPAKMAAQGGGSATAASDAPFLLGFTCTESVYQSNEISFRIWGAWPWEQGIDNPVGGMFVDPPSKGTASQVVYPNSTPGVVLYSDADNEPTGNMAPVRALGAKSEQLERATGPGDVTAGSGFPSPAGGTPSGVSTTPAGENDNVVSPGAKVSVTPTKTVPGSKNAALSADQKKAPYILFKETVRYDYDEGTVVFMPKDTDTAPFEQQSRPRRMIVTQAGYCQRWNAEPKLPDSVIKDPKQRIGFTQQIHRDVPQAISPWVKQYGASWVYTTQVAVKEPDVQLAVGPFDPRVSGQPAGEQVALAFQSVAQAIDNIA